VVIPAGALSEDKTHWNPSHPAFFLPVKILSSDFRDKLLFYLRKNTSKLTIPGETENLKALLEKLKTIPWVVNSQAPKNKKNKPQHIIRYLSRYVSKTAVNEQRIIKLENGKVHLSYFDRRRKKERIEILSEKLFLKRIILHILPKGFKKNRFYGFMANRCRENMLTLCRMLPGIPVTYQQDDKELLNDTAFLFWKYFRVDIMLCPVCGKGHIHIMKYFKEGG
jgi:hypothetical protein